MHELASEIGVQPVDLLNEAKSGINVPMLPSDFRRMGMNSNLVIADEQRKKLVNRLKGEQSCL